MRCGGEPHGRERERAAVASARGPVVGLGGLEVRAHAAADAVRLRRAHLVGAQVAHHPLGRVRLDARRVAVEVDHAEPAVGAERAPHRAADRARKLEVVVHVDHHLRQPKSEQRDRDRRRQTTTDDRRSRVMERSRPTTTDDRPTTTDDGRSRVSAVAIRTNETHKNGRLRYLSLIRRRPVNRKEGARRGAARATRTATSTEPGASGSDVALACTTATRAASSGASSAATRARSHATKFGAMSTATTRAAAREKAWRKRPVPAPRSAIAWQPRPS